MRKILLLGAACAFLSGCAGLNVSWSVVATYNTPHATPGAPVVAAPVAPEPK